ncbi:MAG TPA: hypothetical protein VJS92_06030 [Candidatus Polarisedimenticolaceae bacterium]|nr:hypothetical protein [Candidatus Polarisedimenticolaceae bacterium]
MSRILRGLTFAALVAVFVVGALALVSSNAEAARPGGGGSCTSCCPRQGIYCLDVWNPVICSNGVVYSNSCYAYVACATGCVPYGGETE